MYFNPDLFNSLCTSATSLDTEAVGVPSGMRQKSAVHDAGVERVVGSFVVDDMVNVRKCFLRVDEICAAS